MKKITLLTLSIFLSIGILASPSKSIYGEDDRIDFNDLTDQRHKDWALSTAAMIPSYIIREYDESTYKIKAKMLQQNGICEYERFSRQLTAAECSGFIVSEDLLITAGHCMMTQNDCKSWRWVFDYRQSSKYKIGRSLYVPKSSVYSCKEVIKTVNDGETDFAIIKLDRPVLDRPFLQVRQKGHVKSQDRMTLIGYPSGLPVKVSPNAVIKDANDKAPYFYATTDSFGGNSGSPVINSDTGLVEGILVRGEEDYHYEKRRGKKCLVPTVCSEEKKCAGEETTKISILLPYLF